MDEKSSNGPAASEMMLILINRRKKVKPDFCYKKT